MKNDFWTRTFTKMLRHVAGLLGVGAAFVVSLYFSLVIAEVVLDPFTKGPTSLTLSLLGFLRVPTISQVFTVALFLFTWMFIGAPAFAGGYRFLIGTLDPKHIAQKTFITGIAFYTKRMFVYTVFLVLTVAVLLGLLAVGVYFIDPVNTFGKTMTYILFFAGLVLTLMLFTKLAYVPAFKISGERLWTSVAKSWAATSERFWAIFLIRLGILMVALAPVLIRFFIGAAYEIPSLSLWPHFTLLVMGFEEFIVIRGFQEWEEEKHLPIISPEFYESDISQLEDYRNYDDRSGSMEL